MHEKPFVHLFTIGKKTYAYDVNTNTVVPLEKDLYNCLLKTIRGNRSALSKEEETQLQYFNKQGLFLSHHVQKSEHPETRYVSSYIANSVDSILLQVTQDCNLACQYCIYSQNYKTRNPSHKKMSWATAKAAIDYLLAHSRDKEDIYIGFYGGEPLMNFNLMRKCFEYLDVHSTKNVHFTMTSNATLLTKEVVRTLVKYDVSILVSLDGPKEVNDSARIFAENGKGSYDVVVRNMEYIKKEYPEYYKENISYNVVLHEDGINEVDRYLQREPLLEGIPFLANFLSDIYTEKQTEISENSREYYEYELFLAYLIKSGKLKSTHKSMLLSKRLAILEEFNSHQCERVRLPEKGHRSGPCIPGIQKLFVTADGKLFPCEQVNELYDATCLGDLKSGIDCQKAMKLLNLEQYTTESCRTCWAYSLCNICLAGIDSADGIIPESIEKRCDASRQHAENLLKDYAALIELGYCFEKEKNVLASISQIRDGSIEDLPDNMEKISKSVLFHMTYIQNEKQKLIANELAAEFRKIGRNTILLTDGTESAKDDVNISWFWKADRNAENKIRMLNYILYSLANKSDVDLIIVDIPGDCGEISENIIGNFGIDAQIACAAALPDCTVLSIPFDFYNKSDTDEIRRYTEERYGISIDYINLLNQRYLYQQSNDAGKRKWLTVEDDCVVDFCNNFEGELYRIYQKDNVRILMKRIDEQLRGYHSPLTNSVSANEKHSLATWQEDIAELIMEYTGIDFRNNYDLRNENFFSHRLDVQARELALLYDEIQKRYSITFSEEAVVCEKSFNTFNNICKMITAQLD